MKLFELFADLTLNTQGFDSGVSAARTSADGLLSSISSQTTSIDTVLKELDEEIERLDEEFKDLSLDLEIDDLENEMDALTKDIKKQDFKTSFLEGFYEGLTDAAGDVLSDIIDAGFEFVGESIKTASESGSEAAVAYNKALYKMEIGTENLSNALGNKLLPVMTSVYEGIASLLGVSDYDLLTSMLQQIDSYKFENLKQVEESLRNIFAYGEEYKATEEERNLESMIAGLESQKTYWEDYESTLADLLERGFDTGLLAQLSTGSQGDFGMLSWLSGLTDSELASLAEATQSLEAARNSAAESFSSLRLTEDQQYAGMVNDYENFMRSLDRGGGMRWGTPDDGDTIASDISALSAAIDSLNATISTLPGTAATAAASSLSGAEIKANGKAIAELVIPELKSQLYRDIRNAEFRRYP